METSFVDSSQSVLRVVLAATVAFALVAESASPRARPAPIATRLGRWAVNVSLFLLSAVLRPFVLAAIASRGGDRALAHLPLGVALTLGMLALDGAAYAKHVLFHRVPLFWRFHRVHHMDRDLDWSTGLRFHPIEALVSVVVDSAIIVALAIPAPAVLLHAVVVTVVDVLQHANTRAFEPVARVARSALVTPGMHHAHHALSRELHDTNYGQVLSLWDRLFGTLAPDAPGDAAVGLTEFGGDAWTRLSTALALPFRR